VVSDAEFGKLPDHERYAYLVSYDRIDELLREVTEEQVAEAWASLAARGEIGHSGEMRRP